MTAMRFNASALILTSRMDIGATIGVARRVAQGWERLALETEHNAPTSAKLVLRHQSRREL
jgi:hypothetical protein